MMRWPLLVPALAIAVAVLAPLVLLLGAVLQPDTAGTWSHLTSTVLGGYVGNSLLLLVGVLFLALVWGVSGAWLTATCSFPGVAMLRWGMLLPLALPSYVLAYCWTDVWEFAGPVQGTLRQWGVIDGRLPAWWPAARSLPSACVVLALALYPYLHLMLWTAFHRQSPRLVEAARSLGLGPWAALGRVVLPALRPSLAAGAALVGLETLAEFGAVDHLGVDTITTGIYRTWRGLYSWTGAARLAGLLLVGVALLLALEALTRRRCKPLPEAGGAAPPPARSLHGWRGWLALAWCAFPVLIGFVLPCLRLGYLALHAPLDPQLLSAGTTTTLLAGSAAVLLVLTAVLLAYARRWGPLRLGGACVGAARLGYAIPGSVIAIAIGVPLAWLDNTWLTPAWAWLTGETWRLPLSGSLMILVYAYLVRFQAVALAAVDGGLRRIPPRLDEAARSLGVGRIGVLARVHVPLLAPGVLAGALLVAVEVVKELPASMILRPFGIDTLACRLHQEVASESLSGAAAPALALVALGLLPMWLAARERVRTGTGVRRKGDGDARQAVHSSEVGAEAHGARACRAAA